MREKTQSGWNLYHVAAATLVVLLLVSASGMAGQLQPEKKPPFKLSQVLQAGCWLTPWRLTEKGGKLSGGGVQPSDYQVWVHASCPSATADQVLHIRWRNPDRTVLLEFDYTLKAGQREFYTWQAIAGTPMASRPGIYEVEVRRPGALSPLGTTKFRMPSVAIVAAASAKKPSFTGELGQGIQNSPAVHVTGPTTAFLTDNATVWAVYRAATSPPVGHKLSSNIYSSTGALVVQGDRFERTDGKKKEFSIGFYLAGRSWAVAGGGFVLKVFWDRDPTPVVALPFTVNAGNRWALVVGIYAYDGKPLDGTDHDADSVYDLLVNDFGFPTDHVRRLGESQRGTQFPRATKAAIQQELEWLANTAGPNDTVVFFYAGHGALVPDLSGEQEDGWDPAIVPVDNKFQVVTEAHIQGYVTHRYLREWRKHFKTPNVTIIFDSCHSGGAVRVAEEQPPPELGMGRSITVSVSPEIERKRIEAVQKRRVNPPPAASEAGDRYAYLAAARSWETATGNKLGGAFTNALVQKLREGGGRSWDEVLAAVRDSVTTQYPNQEPNGDGRLRRYPFSLAEATQDAPYVRPTVRVQYAFAPNQQLLSQRLLPVAPAQALHTGYQGTHLVTLEGRANIWAEQIGALYDVYPPGTQHPSGMPLGRVRITGQQACISDAAGGCADGEFATAEILSGAATEQDRLVAVSFPYPSSRPRVAVLSSSDPAGRSTAQQVVDWLARQPQLQVDSTSNLTDVDYVIQPVTFVSGSKVLAVWARNLAEVARYPYASGSANEIAKLLTTRHSQFTRLIKLHNPSPSFGFRAEVEGADRQRSPGDTLTVRGVARDTAWVSLFAANENQPPQQVGTSVLVTRDKPFTLSYNIPSGTQGRLVLKLVATTKAVILGGFNAALGTQRVDTLFRALQASYAPVFGSAPNALAADGWADATLLVSVR